MLVLRAGRAASGCWVALEGWGRAWGLLGVTIFMMIATINDSSIHTALFPLHFHPEAALALQRDGMEQV